MTDRILDYMALTVAGDRFRISGRSWESLGWVDHEGVMVCDCKTVDDGEPKRSLFGPFVCIDERISRDETR